MADPGSFAAISAAFLAAHHVGDFWAQTHYQALHKGLRSGQGRMACAAHVATYTLVTASAVVLVWTVFGLDVSVAGLIAGQLVSAVTHYWADRRFTLAALAKKLGKEEFYRLGVPRDYSIYAVVLPDKPTSDRVPLDNPSLGTGAYALDQSFHWFWLFVAALVTAVL